MPLACKEWEGAEVHPVCPEQGVPPAAPLEQTTAPITELALQEHLRGKQAQGSPSTASNGPAIPQALLGPSHRVGHLDPWPDTGGLV